MTRYDLKRLNVINVDEKTVVWSKQVACDRGSRESPIQATLSSACKSKALHRRCDISASFIT